MEKKDYFLAGWFYNPKEKRRVLKFSGLEDCGITYEWVEAHDNFIRIADYLEKLEVEQWHKVPISILKDLETIKKEEEEEWEKLKIVAAIVV